MQRGRSLISVTALLAVSLFMAFPAQASAWQVSVNFNPRRAYDRERRVYYRHQPYYYENSYQRRPLVVLPFGSVSIVLGGKQYHYWDGYYYQRFSSEYRVAVPPIGAVIRTLPFGYDTVVINNIPYYRCRGAFYQRTPRKDMWSWKSPG